MPESCSNCGAELYGGQQFCRRCGTPVGAAAAAGEAPTQLFGGGVQAGVAAPTAAGTSPLGGGSQTEGVAGRGQTEYQPQTGQQTSVLVGQPFGSRPLAIGAPAAPRRRGGGWLFALLAVFVLGAGVASIAAFLWWRAARTGAVVRVVKTGPRGAPAASEVPPVPEIPEIPADLGERIKEALKGHGVPLPLDESGAVVSGGDTVLTRTFRLDPGASFSAHVVSGNVTVVGSDDVDGAVVKIVKRGGSAQERASTRVLAAESDDSVMLVSAAAPNGRVSVSYEIEVPRGLDRLELGAGKGDIKVSEFDGELDLNVTTGNVSVSTNGAVRSRVVKGKTSVSYVGHHQEAQEFLVTNGDVELFLVGSGPEVELKAASTNGRIEVDDTFGVKAERRGAGHRLEREFGGGGGPLIIKVVNGDIRVRP